MKTHVIQLESHDDIVSVLDKMSWSKEPRILLVWPRRNRFNLRVLDLNLLKRHAKTLGAQVGLVCADREIRLVAEELGIPVFLSNTEAQRGIWRSYERRKEDRQRISKPELVAQRHQVQLRRLSWRVHPAKRLVFFSLGVLAVLAVLLLFLPSAVVYLSPESRFQTVVVPVNASPDFQSGNSYGNVPAYSTRIVIEGAQTLSVSSLGYIPDTVAMGTVQFRNLTGASTIIPIGTVVRTQGESPIRFRTTMEAQLVGGAGQVVEVPIEALHPGSEGNLEAGTIQIIEGNLGLSLAATNPEATTGGTDRLGTMAIDTDRARLYELLFNDLRISALNKLRENLHDGDVIFNDTLSLFQVLEKTFAPNAGQLGDKLSLFLKLEFEVTYTSVTDLELLAQTSMDAGLPTGYVPRANSVSIVVAEKPATDEKGVTHLQIRAKRIIEAQVEPAEVVRLIQGLPQELALQELGLALSLASSPQITITPRGWTYLPFLPFRISVVTSPQSP